MFCNLCSEFCVLFFTNVQHLTSNISPMDASATARAFATYSLVPYLGILFCPGAVLFGSIGLIRSYRSPQSNERTSFYLSILAGLLLLITQLLLWWAMYKVPEWARESGF